MKHSTNTYNTFIQVAEDCPVQNGEIPLPRNGKETEGSRQYNMISANPYKYTSDDIVFGVFAIKNHVDEVDRQAVRDDFFSKGRACLRASPLTKRYGWGIHSDAEGKVALYGMETDEYRSLSEDGTIAKVKAMRSSRK